MASVERIKTLSNVSADDFIGRSNELDIILRHAKGASWEKGLVFLSAPGAGLTELLRQAYDQLFYEQGDVVPVYFRFHNNEKDISQVAKRFLTSFIQQVSSFRKKNPSNLFSSPDVCELRRSFDPADIEWIDPLIDICDSESRLNDAQSFFRLAFSAPARAAQFGVKVFVIFDDLNQSSACNTVDFNVLEELKSLYSHNSRYLFGGRRRALFNGIQTGERVLDQVRLIGLEKLAFSDSGLLIERMAKELRIEITDQARDLIAHQLRGMPVWIRGFMLSAARMKQHLNTYKQVESVYMEGIGSGQIRGWFDTALREIVPNAENQMRLVELLYDLFNAGRNRDPVGAWKRHFNLSNDEFTKMIDQLNESEFINTSSNIIQADEDNLPLRDYIEVRYRLEILRDQRSLVIGSCLSEFLKRAPVEMEGFYKTGSTLGVKQLLSAFDCQDVPESLLNYGKFKKLHKGNTTDQILENISGEKERIRLPQIVYAANTVSIYSPFGKIANREESAVAIGFNSAEYRDENEIVWITSEVNSKLEMDEKQVNFWCDRLEMVAVMCGYSRYKLWLIATDGFNEEAQKALGERDAYGSNRQQATLLAKYINSDDLLTKIEDPNQYEIVLPMGDDTELIAAFAVEEIAKKYEFDAKSINQIKTALVEASINANEHSKSNERKIYHRFVMEDNQLKISVSNRGLRFDGKKASTSELGKGRRGWGINLIKKLMDEVEYEIVDDGSRITMIKYLNSATKKNEKPPMRLHANSAHN